MGNGKPEKGTLYTGNGDKGLTSLLPGSQVSKADERVAAIGGAEESVAALGLVRCVTVCPDFAGKYRRRSARWRQGWRIPGAENSCFPLRKSPFWNLIRIAWSAY